MDEDTDSRTAAFERKRPYEESQNDTQGTSGQNTPRKCAKRQDELGESELGKSVPVGGNFSMSMNPMDDADENRSDVSFDGDADRLGGVSLSQIDQKIGGAAPSINWNVGSRAKIRTTLGGSRAINQISSQASVPLSVPISQAQARDSAVRTSTESKPRHIGTLTIDEHGRPIVALDPSISEISGIKSGVLSWNVKLLNPPPGTVHTSHLDSINGFALGQTMRDGEASKDDDAVIRNLQSEQESGEITEGDLDHRQDEGYIAHVESGRMGVEEPVAAREKKQGGLPDGGVPSKNKVHISNLPFELTESELRESFAAYKPTVVTLTLRTKGPKARMGRGFGFVTSETEELQQRAIIEMDCTMIKGRKIFVKAAIDHPIENIDFEAGEGLEKKIVAIDGVHTEPMVDYSASNPSKVAAIDSMDAASVDDGPAEKRQPQTLADLAPDDLKLQLRYFFITKNPREVDSTSTVRCLVCMQEGHVAESCGTLFCTHCGLHKDHFSTQCPVTQKCYRCRERGHKHEECPYKLGRLAANELECDLCQRTGHTEAKCELLWRTSGKPWESDLAKQNIRCSCYECGSNRHLGNDCPTRKPGKPMGSSTWSLGKNSYGSNKSMDGTIIKGRAQQTSVVVVDDSEDDQANFYRPRIPQPARSGKIHFASQNPNRYQNNSWATNNEPQQDYRTDVNNSYRDSRGYDSHTYRPSERRRSRSPQARYPTHYAPRGGYGGSDDKQLPLPRGPPPGRAGKSGKGPPGKKNTYKPMPSAAKGAWIKHRTGT